MTKNADTEKLADMTSATVRVYAPNLKKANYTPERKDR